MRLLIRVAFVVVLALCLLCPAEVAAQAIPQPSGPVVFCGTQATPDPTSYQLVFDGGAAEPLTMDATKDATCAATDTSSFRLPASRFTVGQHTVVVRATNAFGTTDGPTFTVTVGIAPGPFTITSVKVAQGAPEPEPEPEQ